MIIVNISKYMDKTTLTGKTQNELVEKIKLLKSKGYKRSGNLYTLRSRDTIYQFCQDMIKYNK